MGKDLPIMNRIIVTTPDELRDLVTEIIRNEHNKQPEPIISDQLLTRKEAAALLGITLPTLWDWTRKGTLPGYRISKRVYYKRPEIDAALQTMNTIGRKGGPKK